MHPGTICNKGLPLPFRLNKCLDSFIDGARAAFVFAQIRLGESLTDDDSDFADQWRKKCSKGGKLRS